MKLLNVNWIPSTYLNVMRYMVRVVFECSAVLLQSIITNSRIICFTIIVSFLKFANGKEQKKLTSGQVKHDLEFNKMFRSSITFH